MPFESIASETETARGVDGVDSEQTGAWFWEYGDSPMQIRLGYFITDPGAERRSETRSTRAFSGRSPMQASTWRSRRGRSESSRARHPTEPVGASAETERPG
jgi:hypothetical protein